MNETEVDTKSDTNTVQASPLARPGQRAARASAGQGIPLRGAIRRQPVAAAGRRRHGHSRPGPRAAPGAAPGRPLDRRPCPPGPGAHVRRAGHRQRCQHPRPRQAAVAGTGAAGQRCARADAAGPLGHPSRLVRAAQPPGADRRRHRHRCHARHERRRQAGRAPGHGRAHYRRRARWRSKNASPSTSRRTSATASGATSTASPSSCSTWRRWKRSPTPVRTGRRRRRSASNVEWDAEITADQPGELLAWHSVEGADVDNGGTVRFERGARRARHHRAGRDAATAARRQGRRAGGQAVRREPVAADGWRPAPLQAAHRDRRDPDDRRPARGRAQRHGRN